MMVVNVDYQEDPTGEGSERLIRLENRYVCSLMDNNDDKHYPAFVTGCPTPKSVTEAVGTIDVQYRELASTGYHGCKGNEELWKVYFYRHTTKVLR